jgi:maltoporin
VAQGHPDHWVSLGARPTINVVDHFRVALEAGIDFVDPQNGDSRRLSKVTLAPELAVEAAENGVVRSGSPHAPFTDDDRGAFTFGVQAEAWWWS